MKIEIEKKDLQLVKEILTKNNITFKVKEPKYQIYVEADWNDGDYIHALTIVKTKKEAKSLEKRLYALDLNAGWTEEYEELYDADVIPTGMPDMARIHTITDITITEIY
jgi:hypothetical protein